MNGLDGTVGDLMTLPKSQYSVMERGGFQGLWKEARLPGSVFFGEGNPLVPGSAIIVHSALMHGARARRPPLPPLPHRVCARARAHPPAACLQGGRRSLAATASHATSSTRRTASRTTPRTASGPAATTATRSASASAWGRASTTTCGRRASATSQGSEKGGHADCSHSSGRTGCVCAATSRLLATRGWGRRPLATALAVRQCRAAANATDLFPYLLQLDTRHSLLAPLQRLGLP